MKKITALILLLALLTALAGCGKEETVIEAESGIPEQSAEAVYFHGDENAETLVEEKTQLPADYDPQAVLDMLFEKDVFPVKITVNKWSADSRGLMSIDLGEEFAELIGSTGTAGEYIIMGSLVNTLLKNFELNEIFITADGETLSSGHEIYDYPLSFYEN